MHQILMYVYLITVSFIDLQIFFLLFFGCLLKLVLWIKCNVLLSVLCITKEEK